MFDEFNYVCFIESIITNKLKDSIYWPEMFEFTYIQQRGSIADYIDYLKKRNYIHLTFVICDNKTLKDGLFAIVSVETGNMFRCPAEKMYRPICAFYGDTLEFESFEGEGLIKNGIYF